MAVVSLDGNWQFRAAGKAGANVPANLELDRWMPAIVPGTVHYHLQQLGKIPDPNYGRNELDVQWVDGLDWEWSRTFEVGGDDLNKARQELIFDGLDTVATIYLNDKAIGHSVNMFRQVVCDVRGKLKAGANTVRVLLKSPTAYANAQAKAHPDYVPKTEFKWQTGEEKPDNRAWIRKTQCHFGWDWGVYLATSGIWQSVRLETSDAPRIASITTDQKHAGKSVTLAITARLASPAATTGKLRINVDGQTVLVPAKVRPGETVVRASVTIKNPRLWWPAGEGEQNLYALVADWVDADGQADSAIYRRIGLRTVELIRKADKSPDGKPGESFYFQINGRPVYAKGSNWIPADQLIDRCTPGVYRHLLASMIETNQNIIRVWGGGWYETDLFYDLCDELGLMVWQDFMMACALYPDKPEFLEELSAEAEYQVRRLHTHPSIVLWCGDNENEAAVWEWWKHYKNHAQLIQIYKHVMTTLKNVVDKTDATRPFWNSSPSSKAFDGKPSDPNRGDVHYWTVWHGRQPFSNYLTVKPRFSSEFGFQSFAEPRTMRAVVPADQLNPSSRVMEHHQRAWEGNTLIANTIAREMPVVFSFDSYCWASQINQGLAIRTAVEHWRRLRPWCMGTIIWQINDLWPVASWSSIDYHGRWKALHHMAGKFYAPLLVSITKEKGKIAIWATNDLPEALELTGSLEVLLFNGKRISTHALSGKIKAGGSRAIAEFTEAELLAGKAEKHEVCLFVNVKSPQATAENYETLVPWKWITLPEAKVKTELKAGKSGLELHVQTDAVTPFFHAELDELEGHFTNDWQVLRPGVKYVLRWMPHTERGATAPTLNDAQKRLRMLSLRDLSQPVTT